MLTTDESALQGACEILRSSSIFEKTDLKESKSYQILHHHGKNRGYDWKETEHKCFFLMAVWQRLIVRLLSYYRHVDLRGYLIEGEHFFFKNKGPDLTPICTWVTKKSLPSSKKIGERSCLSSAWSIISGDVPNIFAPLLYNGMQRLFGIWPPTETTIPEDC